MAANGGPEDGSKLQQDALVRSILSSSTKLRISTLNTYSGKVRDDDFNSAALAWLARILFDTYPLYIDRDSRRAAETCLRRLIANPKAEQSLGPLLDLVNAEVRKSSLAPANYFVLAEWCCVILDELTQHLNLWAKWWSQTVESLALALESTLGQCRPSLSRSAVILSRRVLRAIFRQKQLSQDAVPKIITLLTKKSTTPISRNAPLIGVLAGVCARLQEQKPAFEAHKKECYAFYTREIIGSRTGLAPHVAHGLDDLFENFTTLDNLQQDIVPAIEKALLRAPEVVLNDLVTPMIHSLPPHLDLSETLHKNFLKPLLSNVKSSNAAIRSGALKTFSSLAAKATNPAVVEKIADELLNPLKTNKVPGADQKVIYAQMLASLRGTPELVKKFTEGLGPVALKEQNEVAIEAEVAAVAHQLTHALQTGIGIETGASEVFSRGIADKRPNIRRLWALKTADIIWTLSENQLQNPDVQNFLSVVLKKFSDIFKEVMTNPTPASQTGLASPAYAFTALICGPLRDAKDSNNKPFASRDSTMKQALSWDGKPSFLLNPRVYTKITLAHDLVWAVRAMDSVSSAILQNSCPPDIKTVWSQVVLYFLTTMSLPNEVRKEMSELLTTSYTKHPKHMGAVIIQGIWTWLHSLNVGEKDAVPVAAKSDPSRVASALHCICLSRAQMPDGSHQQKYPVEELVLENQLVELLVLARADLLPRVSWIDLCLRVGVDPGALVTRKSNECIRQIIDTPTRWEGEFASVVRRAAYHAAADLAFVAPETAIPLLLDRIQEDLDPSQLVNIGTTEAAIFRTPEGTAYVDVLASKASSTAINKKVKDYDTLKWEEELREQLAKKGKQTKKLTPDEQLRVKNQLAKESDIRKNVSAVHHKLRRGVGIIQALATGPSTDSERWIVQAVDMLQEIINAGAGLLLGDTASLVYLDCSQSVSSRIGSLRKFIGVVTLRAMGVGSLPQELTAESLTDVITRVLYRLRFLAEQRPFDVVSLAYMLPLIFLILGNGGFAPKGNEENDVQLTLSLEFLSFHTDTFVNARLPRQKVLASLVAVMQKFNQHYKLIKDCLQTLVTSIEPNITALETHILLMATIVPEVPVRTAVLQSIDNNLDLSDEHYLEEIWLSLHDTVPENADLARTIWEESEMKAPHGSALTVLKYLNSKDRQLRQATASSCAEIVQMNAEMFPKVISELEEIYVEAAKPRVPEKDEYGIPKKTNLEDPWQTRSGVALTFKALTPNFTADQLVGFVGFMINRGPLGDENGIVREEMIDAAASIINFAASKKVEELMRTFESALESPDRKGATSDKVNEAVVILYGALARHLKSGDSRIPKVVQRLLETLSTPSETVQYAVAKCLPPLVRASANKASDYVQKMTEELFQSKKYAHQRGAAYGLAGIVEGRGLACLREYRIMTTLQTAAAAKKDQAQRQGAFLAYELLSYILGRLYEPYVIQIVPQLLGGFGDPTADVREACLDAAKTCFQSLSSYGVKQIMPILLEGLDDQAWRSKKGACDLLGAMAYLDPQQLAQSLPEIIPPLANVLNDTHKEVRASANRSLQRFGEVINNPEIKNIVSVLLKALSDPTKHTDEALSALTNIQFVHFLDAPSLALVVRILERGLNDRSATKRKAAGIIGNLAHLTERRDLLAHLPILVAGLRVAMVDPVPETRATASKALGSLVEKLGEDAFPDLIPSLMATLKSDTGAGDRLGSAQALSEVLAGLGTSRLEETLPSILQNVSSSRASVREGFMSLFIFLPVCFGTSFSNYLAKIIPPILAGLADEIESIRETALKAGRLLVKNFATRSIDLLLPELERGLGDDNYRIRLSSVELVGDLLFNLSGISSKQADQEEELAAGATEAGQSLLEVLGEDRRNRVLSAIYICRCDTSGLVRAAAINVWKALVATPRTLREIVPTLTQLIIRRLASSNMEQKVIAGNALGELIRKAGEGVLTTLLPTLEEGLESPDAESRQGICMALRDLITSASPDSLEDYEKTLVSVVRKALVDSNSRVREAAAEAFDSLQQVLGKKAVDQVLPHLLILLRTEEEADNALSALLTLLTDTTRSNIILPNLLPTLLTSPMSSFNARAIASLAEVASPAMTRRLPSVINSIVDNIISCKDKDVVGDLELALDTVLFSVDENDGLNTMMSVMLVLVNHDDHRKRQTADKHMGTFIARNEIDISRYYPDLIRVLLIAFDDSDKDVVKAAWTALTELMKRLRKEDMEALVIPTRQVLQQVGVAGSNLPGFELPKGINAILPIFLQGLMYGTTEQRIQSALAISDIISRASDNALKPFVTQITGPLIRVVSERSVEVKAAILFTLNNLLEKIPAFLKPFLPQLQRTFAKSLADTSSETLRVRAAKALGTLITMTPRIDPLIAELVTGSKTEDAGVRNAMMKALYEVVSKAGANMSDVSQKSILGLIDGDIHEHDDAIAITNARLLGVLVKVLQEDSASNLIKNRVLCTDTTKQSILALNAVLAEAPETLTDSFAEELLGYICEGIKNSNPFIADNAVLAAGKYLLTDSSNKSFEPAKQIFDALASVIPPGHPLDTRRLSLVVVRTVARQNNGLVRPHTAALVPPLFASVRDMVVPVKLASEAALLALFCVIDEESVVFDKYINGPGQSLPANTKRSLQDYFKRVVLRLAGQARERREAEGGQGGLGLSSDEVDDEREVWSIGKVDLGEGSFSNE